MKYAIVIPDGCADDPQQLLGGKTPLQAARKPNMDRIAQMGFVGLSNNVPASLTPASDVATLSLFGYDPLVVYTGRAPLEAAAMGIKLSAATRGVLPRTSCRYCRSRKTRPKNAKNCTVIDNVPAAKARWVNSRGSSSGCSRVNSQPTNPASTANPIAIPSSVRVLAQPSDGASMIE